MTVSTTAYTVSYLGNGATTLFTFSFVGVSAADLQVIYTNTSGVAAVLDPSLYTLVINPPGVGQLWGVGGSVTYPISGSPIQVGTILTIQRAVPYEQTVSIANQGAFYPQAVEQGLDLLEMQLQQVEGGFSYAFQAPSTDPNPPNKLPPAALRANNYFAFDSNGQPIVSPVTPNTPTSFTTRIVNVTTTTTVGMSTADSFGGISIFQSGSPVTTVQLPSTGGPYPIFDGSGNAATYHITVLPPAGYTINGQSSYIFAFNNQSATFYLNLNSTVVTVGDPSTTFLTFPTTAQLLVNAVSGLTNGATYVTAGRDTVGDGGGGTFYYNASDTTTADNGGTIRIDWLSRRWYYANNSGSITPQLFGAVGDAIQVIDAVVTTSTVSSASHTFTSADVGKSVIIYLAGPANAGGRHSTWLAKINSVSSGNAILNNTVNTNIASNGIVVFGTDDTTAINNAMASVSSSTGVIFSKPGYLMTNTFKIGSASTYNYCQNIQSIGFTSIYFGIGDFTTGVVTNSVDCVNIVPYNGANGYLPTNITGSGFNFDCMGCGVEGLNILGGYQISITNVNIVRAWRNGYALTTNNSNYIQQVTNNNVKIVHAGLNGIFAWAKATSGSLGFIDEVGWYDCDIESWNENPGAIGATGNELGRAVYVISVGAGNDNFIQGWTFSPPTEINSAVTGLPAGVTQSPDAFYFANGRSSHPLWGTSASSLLTAYKRWTVTAPQIEDSTGGTQATGYLFNFETSTLTPAGMYFENISNNGSYAGSTNNISFTDSNGNRFWTQNAGGSISKDYYGGILAPQALRVYGQATDANSVGVGLSYDGTSGILTAENWGSSTLIPAKIIGSVLNLVMNGGTTMKINIGTGSPNTAVTGSPPDIYFNMSGGAGTTMYVKESGSATNTGWVGK